jgi:hypothetical protein
MLSMVRLVEMAGRNPMVVSILVDQHLDRQIRCRSSLIQGRVVPARLPFSTSARRRITSPLAVWETVIAVSRLLHMTISEAGEVVDDYLELMEIELVTVPPDAAKSPSMRSNDMARAGIPRC